MRTLTLTLSTLSSRLHFGKRVKLAGGTVLDARGRAQPTLALGARF